MRSFLLMVYMIIFLSVRRFIHKTERPTLRALNDYEAIIGQSSFKPANILCVGLDVRSPAVSGYTNYPDGGRVGFNYHRCILTSGYWWPPANSVVTNCLIKQTNVLFYAAFGQATNSASTDKAIQMLNNTVILTSNTGQPLLNTLINQGLMNPVLKIIYFILKAIQARHHLLRAIGFTKEHGKIMYFLIPLVRLLITQVIL